MKYIKYFLSLLILVFLFSFSFSNAATTWNINCSNVLHIENIEDSDSFLVWCQSEVQKRDKTSLSESLSIPVSNAYDFDVSDFLWEFVVAWSWNVTRYDFQWNIIFDYSTIWQVQAIWYSWKFVYYSVNNVVKYINTETWNISELKNYNNIDPFWSEWSNVKWIVWEKLWEFIFVKYQWIEGDEPFIDVYQNQQRVWDTYAFNCLRGYYNCFTNMKISHNNEYFFIISVNRWVETNEDSTFKIRRYDMKDKEVWPITYSKSWPYAIEQWIFISKDSKNVVFITRKFVTWDDYYKMNKTNYWSSPAINEWRDDNRIFLRSNDAFLFVDWSYIINQNWTSIWKYEYPDTYEDLSYLDETKWFDEQKWIDKFQDEVKKNLPDYSKNFFDEFLQIRSEDWFCENFSWYRKKLCEKYFNNSSWIPKQIYEEYFEDLNWFPSREQIHNSNSYFSWNWRFYWKWFSWTWFFIWNPISWWIKCDASVSNYFACYDKIADVPDNLTNIFDSADRIWSYYLYFQCWYENFLTNIWKITWQVTEILKRVMISNEYRWWVWFIDITWFEFKTEEAKNFWITIQPVWSWSMLKPLRNQMTRLINFVIFIIDLSFAALFVFLTIYIWIRKRNTQSEE